MPTQRASFEELLEFANAVREAGGGNPLDALMPAVPQDPSTCLIAKNLNFNCEVAGHKNGWGMFVDDHSIATKIAEKLNLPVDLRGYRAVIELPPEIGQVANDFDRALDAMFDLQDEDERENVSDAERELIADMWPYIEASTREAYDLATIVNEDGSIVV